MWENREANTLYDQGTSIVHNKWTNRQRTVLWSTNYVYQKLQVDLTELTELTLTLSHLMLESAEPWYNQNYNFNELCLICSSYV